MPHHPPAFLSSCFSSFCFPRHCFLLPPLLWRHLLGVACVLFELLYMVCAAGAPQSRSHFVWQVCRKSMRQPSLSSHKLRGNKRAALSRPSELERVLWKGEGGTARFERLPASLGLFFIFGRVGRCVALSLCCSVARLCFKCHFGLCAPVTRGNLN